MRILIFILIIMLSSCKALVRSTVGSYYINTIHNKGDLIQDEFRVELPYEIVGGWIFLNIKQESSKKGYRFIFDTGASTGVSVSVIDDFKGGVLDYHFSSKDINGNSDPTPVYCLEHLLLGDLKINNKNVTADNYPTKRFDGIIGIDLMQGKVFSFDPFREIVTISSNSDGVDKKMYDAYRLRKQWDQHRFLKVKLQDGEKRMVLLDSGYNGFLTLNNVVKSGNVLRKSGYENLVLGVSSIKKQKSTFIQFKDFKLNNIHIDTANVMEEKYFNGNILGSHILNQDITVLDFKNNKIYFKKDLNIKSIGKVKPAYDIGFSRLDNKVVVVNVNTVLSEIDIEPWDILLEINGEKIDHEKFRRSDLEKMSNRVQNQFLFERDGRKIKVELTKEMLGL